MDERSHQYHVNPRATPLVHVRWARLQQGLGTLLDPWHKDSPQDLHHTERLFRLMGSTLYF